jgi:hypothetical protein
MRLDLYAILYITELQVRVGFLSGSGVITILLSTWLSITTWQGCKPSEAVLPSPEISMAWRLGSRYGITDRCMQITVLAMDTSEKV